MYKIIRLVVLSVICLSSSAAAIILYDDAVLRSAERKMGTNIALMVTEDIVRTVPRSMRPLAASIRVQFELRGPNPLSFWSDPYNKIVYVPMESVRFVDDLAILQAWFEKNGCDTAYMQSYLWALLRQGRSMPPPLSAFGVSREQALADRYVDDVSGKILKSAVLFILAHEVGHVVLSHIGGLAGSDSRHQEREADEFALEHFANIGTAPAGMVFYFMAGRWRDPIGTQAKMGTHPVSPERIRTIASHLKTSPRSYSYSEPNPVIGQQQVLSIADEMYKIADLSSDERMLTLLPIGLKAEYPLSRLRSACPG